MKKIDNAYIRMVFFGVVLAVVACREQTPAEQNPLREPFTVGFSTPSGNKIWVQQAEFDQHWRRPVGSMACCWEESGASSGVDNQALPHEVYIQWLDESEKVVYAANIILPPDLPERAKKLPGYTVKHSGRKDPGSAYIIIGMKEHGQVIVWLANAPYKSNVEGRVLEIIGQAQAKGIPWTPPNENDLKNHKPDTST